MEEVGPQVVSPMVIHQALPGRFCNAHPVAKKRGLPFHSTNSVHKSGTNSWNPNSWDWDSVRFVAKPLQSDASTHVHPGMPRRPEAQNSAALNPRISEKDSENIRLKLGGGDGARSSRGMSLVEPQPVSRPSKRVRSGSPGVANYPMCQVDDCKEDLSTAKDYHRRHKVCEVHSKASNALVGTQMQRFCQQCSRFHPLSEFDEGKRSCRRRLAGHNRRRRKTHPEDTTPSISVPTSRDNNASDVDIVNLLAVLTHVQGNTEDRSCKSSLEPDKDQLIQILGKIKSLPLPANLVDKLNGSIPSFLSSKNQNQINGDKSSPSTKDLLAVLSATPEGPSCDAFEIQSPPSTVEGSGSEKSKSASDDQAAYLHLHKGHMMELPSAGGERSCTSFHSPIDEESSPSLTLQLFSPSPDEYSSRKLPDMNYLLSDSSNPSEQRLPISLPPIVHDLFPMHTSREMMKDDHLSSGEREVACVKATMSNGCSTSLQLFGCSTQVTENGSVQSSPYRAGYTSSSGSDHSPPSSLNSDAQDRTGRIVFKLFDKDPSQLPGSLRSQISNWLSNSPSEMEGYIRPGCVVLSMYLSMPSFVWDQFEKHLLNYMKSLIKDIEVEFWGNGRFLVYTDRQMASHKDGKIRLCKSWRAWNTPELISVSPVAVVSGQETSLILRGRNLKAPDTKVFCTHADGYNVSKLPASSCQEAAYDEISLGSFKINRATSSMLGRCFIEVETSSRGSSFPVIIANNNICQELSLLEPEINGTAKVCDGISNDIQSNGRSKSREDVLHFLNELGWLFQRKHNSCLFDSPEYRVTRFKFLLMFSVEHDFCALVKTLMDLLLELNLGRKDLAKESFVLLSEIHLLNVAVKRRCQSMVDLLVHYSIIDSANNSRNYIFLPNMAGPGGITPLHLAACTSSSDDLVDGLTNDPQEVGLNSWNTVLDANGLSPYAYALKRNNHSYNALVSRKLSDRENGHVSVSINEIEKFQVVEKDNKTISSFNKGKKSCSRCAVAQACGYRRKLSGSQGLLQRPYINSVLVIAAVCVCVCVFLRGRPYVNCFSPIAWENVGFGAS